MPTTKLPARRRIYQRVYAPIAGLQYNLGATMIDILKTPNCSEIVFREGKLTKGPGTSYFAYTNVSDSGLPGTVLSLYHFKKTNDTSFFIAFTDATGTAYGAKQYSTSPKTFTNITNGSGHTGSASDFFCAETFSDTCIWTNNKDTPRKWTGSGAAADLGGTPPQKAKWILKFGERLVAFNTTEGGTLYAQRVRWTIVGSAENWTGSGSGFTDLITSLKDDIIMRAEKLASYIIIYGQHNVVVMAYTGIVEQPFTFETIISGQGLSACRALVNKGSYHVFLGWQGVYKFDGSRELTELSTGLSEEIVRLISPTNIHYSFMSFDETNDEALLHIPTSGHTTPDTYFRLSLKTGSWSRGNREYTGIGYYENKTARTWDDMTHSWDSDQSRWNDSQLLSIAPLMMYGNNSGHVVAVDETIVNWADGTAISSNWDTKDFVIETGYRREDTEWMELNFEAKGNRIDVQYSIDGGSSWSSAKTVTLTSATEWKWYNYDIEVTSEIVRFRFTNTAAGSTFHLRQFEIGYIHSTDRERE